MKNWFSQVVGLCALLFVFSACEKDETKATLTPTSSPTLTASTSTIVLVQGRSTTPAVTYTWAPISFDWKNTEHAYAPAVTYTLQLDKQGNNFAAPVTLEAGAGPNTIVTYGQLNNALISLGLTPGIATPVEMRLRSILPYAANNPLYTSAVPLVATAFECKAPVADGIWTIIGPAGVDWNTDIQMTYDCDLQAYTLTRALKAGDFKFRQNRAWTVDYGGGTRNANGTGPLLLGGTNITVPTAGTYTIIFNLNTMTYTLTQ
ncbi:SusE domain-containing protein [Hymenobacter norwichensis]|uniref:SusE domain-containing protein n=1 Tax=Hymenobacter norwichensis TaxID=223903 RepID=UPI0003B309DF|nr:SusE domain-containing protein [Hymenobacter norwichensis]